MDLDLQDDKDVFVHLKQNSLLILFFLIGPASGLISTPLLGWEQIPTPLLLRLHLPSAQFPHKGGKRVTARYPVGAPNKTPPLYGGIGVALIALLQNGVLLPTTSC